MLSGDNGILQKATTAKTETEKSQEQEVVTLAYNSALAKKVSNGDSTAVTDGDLNTELTNQGAKAKGNNPITVTFDVSKRQYTIDNGIVNFAGIKSDSDVEEDTPQEITASTPAGTVVITPNNWTTLQGKAISDGNGTAIPLPTGFFYVGGDYNTGLVISDKENDTMDASGISMGNQFVWIPVPNQETLIRTEFDSNGSPMSVLSSDYSEPFNYTIGEKTYTGYSTEESEYNSMRTQVLKYKGFYIGRYESGLNQTTIDTWEDPEEIVCKKGVRPYGWAIMPKVEFDNNGVYESSMNIKGIPVQLSQKMYSHLSSITSTLSYGCQWDAMCRYIADSNREPESSQDVNLTGSTNSDVSKHIYDLAGNCTEWTMEVGIVELDDGEEIYERDLCRVCRGGSNIGYGGGISSRCPSTGMDVYNYDGDVGFRVSLYIN